MKRVFRPMAVAALVAVVAALCVLVAFDQRELTETAAAVNTLSDQVQQQSNIKPTAMKRVVQLPNDGQAYYLSVVVRPDYVRFARDRQVVGWFRGHRRLMVLPSQTHFNIYTNTDAVFKTNLAHMVGGCPAVIVQDAKGSIVYSSWEGDKLPEDPDQLADDISSQLETKAGAILPWRRRHEAQPSPSPTPGPDNVDTDVEVVVNRPMDLPPKPVVPNGKGSDADFWIVLAIAILGAAAAAFVIEFKREAKAAP